MLSFFAPTRPKLMFLALWSAYLVFEAVTGFLRTQWAPALLVLVFFYCMGCVFAVWAEKARLPLSLSGLSAAAGACLLLDQGLKALIAATLPAGQALALLPGALEIEYAQNLRTSWLVQRLNLEFMSRPLMIGLTLLLLVLFAVAAYRSRDALLKSPWTGLAFVFLAAGVLSALADQTLRGFTVDFIGLPGLFVADLKDIFLFLGVSSGLNAGLETPSTPDA